MAYFNYHGVAKKLIRENKLIEYYFTIEYNKISPALVLVFDDLKHQKMVIRKERWAEYIDILPSEKKR